MREVYYITSFRQLKISHPVRGYIQLIPGVNITNDPKIKRKFLSEEFAHAAGVIETDFLQNAPNIVFGEFRLSDMKGAHPEPFLLTIIIWIHGLFKNAWLLKDHAMQCDAAFLTVQKGPNTPLWTSNFIASRPSFADGEVRREVSMSRKELLAWGAKNDQVESYLHQAESSPVRFMMEKGYARSGRAMQYINVARNAPDLAFKIAHYCSALETLFTTDSSELAHKLSERVAFFMETEGYDALQVFRTIKQAYNVRSKLVHGDTLSDKIIDSLPDLSIQCDKYLRVIMNIIFNEEELRVIFDSHNQAIENYFSELIFGKEMEDGA